MGVLWPIQLDPARRIETGRMSNSRREYPRRSQGEDAAFSQPLVASATARDDAAFNSNRVSCKTSANSAGRSAGTPRHSLPCVTAGNHQELSSTARQKNQL